MEFVIMAFDYKAYEIRDAGNRGVRVNLLPEGETRGLAEDSVFYLTEEQMVEMGALSLTWAFKGGEQ